MKTIHYEARVKETGEVREFESLGELRTWAAKATITFQSSLRLEVSEIVKTKRVFLADYQSGDVQELVQRIFTIVVDSETSELDGKTFEITAHSEREAHDLCWQGLSDDEKDQVNHLEVVDQKFL